MKDALERVDALLWELKDILGEVMEKSHVGEELQEFQELQRSLEDWKAPHTGDGLTFYPGLFWSRRWESLLKRTEEECE